MPIYPTSLTPTQTDLIRFNHEITPICMPSSLLGLPCTLDYGCNVGGSGWDNHLPIYIYLFIFINEIQTARLPDAVKPMSIHYISLQIRYNLIRAHTQQVRHIWTSWFRRIRKPKNGQRREASHHLPSEDNTRAFHGLQHSNTTLRPVQPIKTTKPHSDIQRRISDHACQMHITIKNNVRNDTTTIHTRITARSTTQPMVQRGDEQPRCQ